MLSLAAAEKLPGSMITCWRVKTWLSMRTTGNHKGGSCNHRDNVSKAKCFPDVTSGRRNCIESL